MISLELFFRNPPNVPAFGGFNTEKTTRGKLPPYFVVSGWLAPRNRRSIELHEILCFFGTSDIESGAFFRVAMLATVG
jgi:hypothetical protein